MGIFVHVLTFNTEWLHLKACLESVINQEGFLSSENSLVVTDNASDIDFSEKLQANFDQKVVYKRNQSNLGFCGGHNSAVKIFLAGNWQYLLILNPDLILGPKAIRAMVDGLERYSGAGLATPKLRRANERLEPIEPPLLDACGMELTAGLRHFDRGAGQSDCGQYEIEEDVFGGTGACLMLARSAVEQLLLKAEFDQDAALICPELLLGQDERAPLFDEAFFAYREDADLCWRAKHLGISCIYIPSAVAYHVRRVTPERRASLPAEINAWSVRNRFLLQINNYSFIEWPSAFFKGIIWRNLIVLLGVIFMERKSLGALLQVWLLRKRAFARRKALFLRRNK